MSAQLLHEFLDYLFSIAPIIYGHVAIPPLIAFGPSGQLMSPYFFFQDGISEFFVFVYRHLSMERFLEYKYVKSLLLELDNNNKMQSEWTTLISHMFVHGDYKHLMNNLQGIITHAYPVYDHFGPVVTNLLFITGGIAASIPITPAVERVMDAVKPVLVEKSIEKNIFWFSPDAVEMWLKSFQPVLYVGSSGGVCSLLGCSTVLTLRCLYRGIILC